jgi:hypothetical protein
MLARRKPRFKTAEAGAIMAGMASQSRRKLLLIEWIDAHSGKGWQPLDEIAKAAEPVHCRSVGWLVSEGNGTTVLVSHISGEKNGNLRVFGTGDMAIPTKAIVRRSEIRTS